MGWETSKPVIVPVDFSGMSVQAVRTGLQLAAAPSQVHVVHVVPVLDQIVSDVENWSIPSDEDRREAVRRHFREFLNKNQFQHLKEVVLDGQPGPKIAEYAAANGAGVIVIPSHGYHGLKRILLGSVAEKVIRLANCPVFILRREDAE
ncbi:MAG: universal stress protein [Fuerstiella sp.]